MMAELKKLQEARQADKVEETEAVGKEESSDGNVEVKHRVDSQSTRLGESVLPRGLRIHPAAPFEDESHAEPRRCREKTIVDVGG